MDISTLLSFVISIGGILFGNHLEGGHIGSLINLPAFLIVMGGTFGACLLETNFKGLKRSIVLFTYAFFPPKVNYNVLIEKIVEWNTIVRKSGLLGLEAAADSETDHFAKRALFLLIDGSNAEAIQEALEIEMETHHAFEHKAVKFYESAGGYAPTVGILGAVLALIHVMGNLSDPSKLGPGIAVAFVATVYGVGSANLIFLPISKKITMTLDKQAKASMMIIQGAMSISAGENPKLTESKLRGFI